MNTEIGYIDGEIIKVDVLNPLNEIISAEAIVRIKINKLAGTGASFEKSIAIEKIKICDDYSILREFQNFTMRDGQLYKLLVIH